VSGDFLSGVPIRPPVRTGGTVGTGRPGGTTSSQSFSDVLANAATGTNLKFSAHALSRIEERGVKLTSQDVDRMDKVVSQMADKGTKEAYLFYGSDGFVVNVPNRTVITAMSHDSTKIITNVDGVAIIPRLDQ
jgi:flagellar operon protein